MRCLASQSSLEPHLPFFLLTHGSGLPRNIKEKVKAELLLAK